MKNRYLMIIAISIFSHVMAAPVTATTVNAVKSTVTLGGGKATYGAQGVAFDPVSGLFYIALNGNIVSGCDGDPVSGSSKPESLGAQQISVLDPASAKELTTVGSGSGPVWPFVDPYRRVVYVANSGSGTLTLHDPLTGAKQSSISVGGMPHLGVLDFSTRLMVVGNTVSQGTTVETQNHASIVDTTKAVVTREFVSSPAVHGAVVDQLRHIAYYTAVGNGAITAIDTTTGQEIMTAIPKSAYSSDFGNNNLLARQASSRLLFQTNSQAGYSGALIVDETTLAAKGVIAFGNPGRRVWGLWVDEASRLLFAAIPNSNEIGVADLDTFKHVASIPVGQCPYSVAVDPIRHIGVASNQGSSKVNASASIFDLCPVYAALGRTVSGCSTPTSGATNLLATVDGSSLKLAWKQSGGSGMTTRLQVGGYLTAAIDMTSGSEQFDFSSVPAGTYDIRLVSTDAQGKSTLSNTVLLNFPANCTAPQTPANVVVSKSGQSVTVSWDLPASGSAPSQYRLNVSGGMTGSYTLTSRSVSGTVPVGSYNVSVEAVNACGSSAPSTVQTIVVS